MLDVVNRIVAPLRTRVVNMIARAVIDTIDDSEKLQLAQVVVLKGELRGAERVQNYGFTSVPKKGAEAVIVRVGGAADHGVIIAVDDRRYRVTGLEDGEVAMYDATGTKITLKKNGDIEVVPSSGKTKITGDLSVSGALDVTGKGTFSDDVDVSKTLTATTDVVGGGKHLKTHVHAGSSLTTTALVASSGGSPGTIGGSTAAPT